MPFIIKNIIKMPNEINKQIVSDLNTSTDQLKNQVVEINKSLDDLLKRQKDLVLAGEKSGKAYQDVAAQVRVAKDAVKEITAQIDENIKSLNLSKNSLQQNKGFLQALMVQYDELSKSQGNNSKEVKALNIQIGALSNTIANQEEKLTKSRKVFDAHKSTNEAFKESFDKLNKVSGNFGPGLQEASEGFNALKSGLETVKTGFQSVGSAIKTTGFGLLVLVLQSLFEYFTKNAEGINKLKGGLAVVGFVVEKVKGAFQSLGKFIVDAVSHPIDSIKNLANLIRDNIINRFKSFAVILDGIIHLDFKKVTDGVLQNITGVTHATDKIKVAFNAAKNAAVDAGNEISKTYKKAHDYEKKNDATAKALHKKAQKRHQEKMKMHQEEAGTAKQGQKREDNAAPIEKTYQDSLIKQMQVTANGLAKKVELQHNSYAEEQATLKRLYDNKLISQEQYQQESTQLEEKYQVGIGEIIKRMNAEDLEKVEKQQKELVETQQQKELLTKDQHDVDKAILPWNKLEAEKKLITDKYNFEIKKAAEAGKDTTALRLQYQEKITEATKKSEEQRKALAIQAAQQISSAAFSIISNSIKSSSDAKIKGMESDKAKELSNTNLTKTQRAAIEAKYKKKENDEKVKAFKANQKMQIAQAVINGAIAVSKTISEWGMPLAIPFIVPTVAMTAIQIATIASQKPPAFAKGGRFVSDGRGALLPGYSRADNTNAYLRSGEAVVVSEAMRNPWARNLVSAINVAHGGRDFSAPNTGKGFAIGGIFTDGGNANRYYNQPVNDIKEMANTVAYQMINNFPPIYVDVKDVNNQQNILAQTVDRVNL
jgi:hypothetical protein